MARAIKIAQPNAHIGFVCREYTQPIVERCPDIDEVIVRPDASTLAQDRRLFTQSRWDAVFFPNAHFDLAFAAAIARIPIRVGTGYRWYSSLYTERIMQHRKTAEHHEAEYNLRMLSTIGIHADPSLLPPIVLRFEEITRVQAWRERDLGDAPYAVLHTGSGGSSHSWSTENWVELARHLATTTEIVLTGSESERKQIEAMQSQLEANAVTSHTFVGRPLPDLAALLYGAQLVVSGSTGPGHLAAALGTATIGLFPLPKALSKERWGFRGKHVQNVSPTANPDCPHCADCDCMARVSAQQVVEAAPKLIS